MTQQIKACKDCKHYYSSARSCTRYVYEEVDYRIGKKVQRYIPKDISTERMSLPDRCGREAKYFEPKLTLFQKIKNLFVKEKT